MCALPQLNPKPPWPEQGKVPWFPAACSVVGRSLQLCALSDNTPSPESWIQVLPRSFSEKEGWGCGPLCPWAGGQEAPQHRRPCFCRGSARPPGTASTTATRTSPARWTRRTSAGSSTTAATSSRGCTSSSTNSCETPGGPPPGALSPRPPVHSPLPDCPPAQALCLSCSVPAPGRDLQASGCLCSPQVWFEAFVFIDLDVPHPPSPHPQSVSLPTIALTWVTLQ